MIATRIGKFSTFALQLAVSMLVLTSGGCQGLVFLLAGDSGITGVTYGYGCGVEPLPEFPQDCTGGAPIQAVVVVRSADGQTEVARVTSEPDGTFRISLLPGTYSIRDVGSFVVAPGEYTEVNVGFAAE